MAVLNFLGDPEEVSQKNKDSDFKDAVTGETIETPDSSEIPEMLETDNGELNADEEKEIIDWKALFDAGYDESLNDGSWVLTPPSKNKAGLVISKNRYPVDRISISFKFKITNNGGSGDDDGSGADGISFAITPNNESQMDPGKGGAIGFRGIGGFAVELDSYKNSGEVNGNHVAIMSDENGSTEEHKVVRVDSYRFNDGKERKVTIVIDRGVVSVAIDGELLINKYSIPNYEAFEGHMVFSSATGNGWGKHQVWDVFAKLL